MNYEFIFKNLVDLQHFNTFIKHQYFFDSGGIVTYILTVQRIVICQTTQVSKFRFQFFFGVHKGPLSWSIPNNNSLVL